MPYLAYLRNRISCRRVARRGRERGPAGIYTDPAESPDFSSAVLPPRIQGERGQGERGQFVFSPAFSALGERAFGPQLRAKRDDIRIVDRQHGARCPTAGGAANVRRDMMRPNGGPAMTTIVLRSRSGPDGK